MKQLNNRTVHLRMRARQNTSRQAPIWAAPQPSEGGNRINIPLVCSQPKDMQHNLPMPGEQAAKLSCNHAHIDV